MTQKITVTYSAWANVDSYGGDRENIHISVEIDDFKDYDDTLELLRTKVLEKLNLRERHEKLMSKYDQTRRDFIKVTEQLESANQQWELARNFLKAQGSKTDTAEFPKEALTNLSKSLPATSSGYPEWDK